MSLAQENWTRAPEAQGQRPRGETAREPGRGPRRGWGHIGQFAVNVMQTVEGLEAKQGPDLTLL